MTVAAGDAHEFPIYAGRYRVYFPLLDADGDLVTGATTPDSERSIDAATFADCTNEMTELATNSGVYYLDLTAAETTSKCTVVIAKSATSGMKTTTLTLYPKRMPILRSGTAQAGAGSTITLDSGASAKNAAYAGLYIQCSNNSPSNVQGQTRKILSYVGSTKVATVEAAWGTNPSSATTFDILIPETVNLHAIMGNELPDWTVAGVPKVDVSHLLGTAWLAPGTAGTPDVNVKLWNALTTVALPLVPATPGRTLVVDAAGLADANMVKAGPTGSGTAQTARDLGGTLGAAGAGLTAIQLPSNGLANVSAWTVAITGNVTGNLSGSVGSVTGLTASNLDTTVSSRLATSGYTVPPTAASITTAVLTTQMTESYAANGVAPTLAQAMMAIHQELMDFSISGTAYTVKKLDNFATAFVVTLSDATNPTGAART